MFVSLMMFSVTPCVLHVSGLQFEDATDCSPAVLMRDYEEFGAPKKKEEPKKQEKKVEPKKEQPNEEEPKEEDSFAAAFTEMLVHEGGASDFEEGSNEDEDDDKDEDEDDEKDDEEDEDDDDEKDDAEPQPAVPKAKSKAKSKAKAKALKKEETVVLFLNGQPHDIGLKQTLHSVVKLLREKSSTQSVFDMRLDITNIPAPQAASAGSSSSGQPGLP